MSVFPGPRRGHLAALAAAVTAVPLVLAPSASATTPAAHVAVAPRVTPLRVTTTALPTAVVGAPYRAALSATGGTPPYLWQSPALPAWLVLDPSGLLHGTPPDAVAYSATFSVVDSLKNKVSAVLKVAVVAPLQPAGQALAWGSNDHGQLGLGDTTDRPLPVAITGLTSAHAIASSADAGYALKSDGTVVAWGTNANGELGDGTLTDRYSPAPVQGMTLVRTLAAGHSGAMVLQTNKTAYGWGYNGDGALGIDCPGVYDFHAVPKQVPLSSLMGVALGGDGYELRADGTVWRQGIKWYGDGQAGGEDPVCPEQIPGLSSMTAIASGGEAVYALGPDGTVWAWGDNTQAELGDGSNLPVAGPVQVAGLPKITAISAGGMTGYALAADGTVWAWGDNSHGAVGGGSLSPAPAYSPVQVIGLTSVTQIAGGEYSGYALRSDGTVWAWGDNSHGQLANEAVGSTVAPVQVSSLKGVVAICASSLSTSAFAIRAS